MTFHNDNAAHPASISLQWIVPCQILLRFISHLDHQVFDKKQNKTKQKQTNTIKTKTKKKQQQQQKKKQKTKTKPNQTKPNLN